MTGLPVAWHVETAKDSELPLVPVLLDTVTRRGFIPDVSVLTVAMTPRSSMRKPGTGKSGP